MPQWQNVSRCIKSQITTPNKENKKLKSQKQKTNKQKKTPTLNHCKVHSIWLPETQKSHHLLLSSSQPQAQTNSICVNFHALQQADIQAIT